MCSDTFVTSQGKQTVERRSFTLDLEPEPPGKLVGEQDDGNNDFNSVESRREK